MAATTQYPELQSFDDDSIHIDLYGEHDPEADGHSDGLIAMEEEESLRSSGWIVTKICFSKEYKRYGNYDVPYPFWIMGYYRDNPDQGFTWNLPYESILDPYFDFSNAIMTPMLG